MIVLGNHNLTQKYGQEKAKSKNWTLIFFLLQSKMQHVNAHCVRINYLLTLWPTAFWDFVRVRGGHTDPENKVDINWLTWNMILVCTKLVKMQNFKLLAFLLLEIWCHKNSGFPEGNESLQYDIYPLESSKIQEKRSIFIPESIF